jgi:hypothetical protein
MHRIPIGESFDTRQPFFISPADRAKHMAVFGKSGVGKTNRFREEAIAPLLNKVNKFVTSPLLRACSR